LSENKLVPNRRFKEFQDTDAWEQRKLGDIAEKITVGIATSSSKYFSDSQNGVPFIKNQDIKENKLNTSNLEYISKEFDKKNINKRIQAGDILTARTGYPGLSAVVPEYLNGAQTFTTLITRIIKEQASPFFISIYINSPSGMKQINGMEAGGAQKNVNAGILKEMNTTLPSLDEQYKISDFVLSLESIITLHQRKLEKSKALKSAYLAEMFPAEGERVPKRRFSGFTSEWEKKRLGDISNSFSGGTPTAGNKLFYGGEIPFIRSGEVNSKNTGLFITEEGLKTSSAKLVSRGDILYALYGATSGEVGISQINGAINQAVLAIKPDHGNNAYFITQWLRKQKPFIIETYLQGGQGNLSGNIVKQLLIDLPQDKNEQKEIGEFFRKLDDTIRNNERKLKKLKAMKQAYLEEMFV